MVRVVICVLVGWPVLFGCAPGAKRAAPLTLRDVDLERYFDGNDGCFVMFGARKNELVRYNAPRCERRFSPGSTFMIANALVGLETGILRDADHMLRWDNEYHRRGILNQDHDLRSAMKYSVPWYFQRVAMRVGPERMQQWLDRLEYGNRDISGGVQQFWLGSSLTISPNEQVEFLRRLRLGELDCSQRSQEIVRDVLTLDDQGGRVLHGKTGTQRLSDGQALAWFVGFLEDSSDAYVFALNVQGSKRVGGAWARELCERILDDIAPPHSDRPTRPPRTNAARKP